jgi:hypothetical protein
MPPNFDSGFDRDFLLPQLGSEDGDFDNFEYFEDFGNYGGISDDDHDEEGIGDRNGVKFMYWDSTWNQDHIIYEPKHMEFRGILFQIYFGAVFLLSFNYLSCFYCTVCVGEFYTKRTSMQWRKKIKGL